MLIRRYGNNRYFNVDEQGWTNTASLAEALASGATLEAVDATSGEDLTSLVLANILVAEAQAGRPRSPAMLHAALREPPVVNPAHKGMDKLGELFQKVKAAPRGREK